MVVENLTNMRGRTKIKKATPTWRRIRGWSFGQLRGCIAYKAEERGLTVVGVDPRHTSHTCSACWTPILLPEDGLRRWFRPAEAIIGAGCGRSSGCMALQKPTSALVADPIHHERGRSATSRRDVLRRTILA